MKLLIRSFVAGLAMLVILSNPARAAVAPDALLGQWEAFWIFTQTQNVDGEIEGGTGQNDFDFTCFAGGSANFADYGAKWKLSGKTFQVDASQGVKQELISLGGTQVKAKFKITKIDVLPSGADKQSFGTMNMQYSITQSGVHVKVKAHGSFKADSVPVF